MFVNLLIYFSWTCSACILFWPTKSKYNKPGISIVLQNSLLAFQPWINSFCNFYLLIFNINLLLFYYKFSILTFSNGFTTANRNPPSMEFSLKVTTIENSGYSFSGKNNRYGDFTSDPGFIPNAGKPSSPLSKYNCGSSNGTLMAVWRSCSPKKFTYINQLQTHLYISFDSRGPNRRNYDDWVSSYYLCCNRYKMYFDRYYMWHFYTRFNKFPESSSN